MINLVHARHVVRQRMRLCAGRGHGRWLTGRFIVQRGVNTVTSIQLHDLPTAIAEAHGVQTVGTDGAIGEDIGRRHRLHGREHHTTAGRKIARAFVRTDKYRFGNSQEHARGRYAVNVKTQYSSIVGRSCRTRHAHIERNSNTDCGDDERGARGFAKRTTTGVSVAKKPRG